ncbi:MAG: pentapeptide repeat-containing protein [Planctomycetaceae bacterium]|nr:pentapeptide repeat-containing protein [Planctomycetaceae bacterium]
MKKRLDYAASFDRLKKSDGLQGGAKPDVVERPRPDAADPGPYYSRTELLKNDLSRLTLPGLYAARCDFRGVDFAGSDLHLSTLCWNEFLLCDFRGADLSRCDLRASNFQKCSFAKGTLDGCDLRHATFEACEFTDATMKGAVLTNGQRKKLPLSDAQVKEIEWVDLGGAFPDGA